MELARPEYLVEADWLAAHADDPALRILEATVFLQREGDRLVRRSGRAEYEQGHLPGAAFADLIEALSDPTSPFPFMLPPAEQFARVVGQLGVGNEHRVVCYDRAQGMWATRLWWLFRVFGHEHVAVLNGGFQAWVAGGYPISREPPAWPATTFHARFVPALLATKEEVCAALGDSAVCTINALAPEVHRGEVGGYARRGRIPGSVNVPAATVFDPATGRLRPPEELRALFQAVGALERPRVITYCGGGIAATADAFALTLLGHPNVAVYDGSLSEWTADPALPLEVG
ncbi:MAG: sulfurtransferase [Dehalococcoidia bacterium]|nr:MAG: sulfurtransferase [Dehalococcoidia bacterium]